jgi:hypothetical protein
MTASRRIFRFINIGLAIDHMFVLMLPAAMRGMQADFARPYRELIAFSLGGSSPLRSSPLEQDRCPPDGS